MVLRTVGATAVVAAGGRTVTADEETGVDWSSFFGPGHRRCTPHEVPDTPTPAWETEFPSPAVPIFADGTLFATTDGGEVYRVDHHTGTESFLGELPGDTFSMRYLDGVLYVADDKAVVAAIETETGETVWKRKLDRLPGRPVVHDGSLFYPFRDTGLARVDLADGTTTRTLPARTTQPVPADGYPPQLVVSGDVLVLSTVADGGRVIAQSTAGNVVWRQRVPGARAIAATDSTAFVVERPHTDPRVVALDTETGDRRWVAEVPGDRPPGRPVVCADHVFVGGDFLTAVDRETGVIDWQRELTAASMVVAGETLYLLTVTSVDAPTIDSVRALDARSGDPRWESGEFTPGSTWKLTAVTDAGPVFSVDNRLARFGPENVVIDELPVVGTAAAVGAVGVAAYLWRRAR